MSEAFPVICIKPDEDATDCYTGDSGGMIVELIGDMQSFEINMYLVDMLVFMSL